MAPLAGPVLAAGLAGAARPQLATPGAEQPETRRPAGDPARTDATDARQRHPAQPPLDRQEPTPHPTLHPPPGASPGRPPPPRPPRPRPRRDAQTAIVVFAGSAHTLVPLSDDLATSRNLLESLTPSIMPEPGRRSDLALDKALQLLEQG